MNDLRLLAPEQRLEEGWLVLGREPLQLLFGAHRRLVNVVYRRGEADPLTGLALFPSKSPPDRRIWTRDPGPEFRSAAKDSPPEAQALWLRRGNSHPPVRRLALITGPWSEMAAVDWVELRSQWRMIPFDFSDTLADFACLAFSIR